jgi:phosphoserine phosphatase
MKAKTLVGWAEHFGVDSANTVAVGDGANDIQMLQAAGFAVAFRPKEILRQYADLVIEGNSLKPLIAELGLRSR